MGTDWLTSERLAGWWGILTAAPELTVTLLVLMFAGGYFAARWRYIAKAEHLEERLKLKDDQIADLQRVKTEPPNPNAITFLGGETPLKRSSAPPLLESKSKLWTLDEAAAWLYENSVQAKRHAKMPGTIGTVYPTLRMFCLAALLHAGGKGVCTIYARPEPGFGLERVEENDLEIASHMASLGAQPGPFIDGCIGPEQVERVRDWIDSDPSNLHF